MRVRTSLLAVMTAALLSGSVAHGQQAFTAGRLVVYRAGDGSAALGATATAVFLDEFAQAGAAGISVAAPTTANGANARLTGSGSATSEGMLQLSNGGATLALAGYDAAVGTGAVAGTTSAAVNRVVGLVSGQVPAAGFDTTTRLNNFASAGNPRGAFTTDGTNVYVSGTPGGVSYTTVGATTATAVSTVTNARTVQVVGGQLYLSANSGTVRVATVGTGTPTTGAQANPNLPGTPTTGSPYQFFLARIGAPSFAGPNVLYVADDTASAAGGILKYLFDGTNWTAAGSVPGGAGTVFNTVRGLTGLVTGDNAVQLFGSSGTTLGTVTDSTAGAAGTFNTPTTLATAGTNTAYRGTSFAPAQLSWNGTGGTWDLNAATIFTNTAPAAQPQSAYFNAYAANFGNTGVGPVTVGTGINPPAVNVSNTTGTYTFTNGAGSNGIQGLATLTKSGGGTLVLASPNTYSGATSVTGGTLLVTNTSGSATGSGPVAVVAGTFGGAGLAAGPLTTSAATVAPGSPTGTPGSLTTGSVIFGTGSTWAIRVPGSLTGGVAVNSGSSGTAGTANSLLTSAGGINLQSLGTLTVDLIGATGLVAGQQYSLQIGNATSGSNSITGTQFTNIVFSNSPLAIDATSANVQLNGTGVFLNFVPTPVPEPVTVLAVAAVGLAGVRAGRRLTASSRRPG